MAAFFLLALALAVALSVLTLLRGRAVNETTLSFVREDVPMFRALSDLKAAILRQEPILYEYYATTDRGAFSIRYQENKRRIEQGMLLLRDASPQRRTVTDLTASYREVEALATQLDQTLAARGIDWDLARELLAKISKDAAVMNEAVDSVITALGTEVNIRGDATLRRVREIVVIVIGSAVAVLLLMVLAGFSMRAYLLEARMRRELALFPENNPHPILSLNTTGRVVYANSGALRAIGAKPGSTDRAEALLPLNMQGRIVAMTSAGRTHERFDYEMVGRAYECEVHALPDFDLFHVYISDVTERRRAEQQLVHQAFHDALTELPNRFSFEKSVTTAMSSPAPGSYVSVLLITVDRMRLFIDSFGHQWGDLVLKAVAARLARVLEERAAMFPGTRLFRMDGAQFAVLLPRTDKADAAEIVAEAIQAAARESFRLQDREFFVTFSIGAASYPEDGGDPVTLVKNTDAAMQAIKLAGGNGWRRYAAEINERILEALEMETELRHALERRQLSLAYQPQVRLSDGHLVGFEALLRWKHPTFGMVSPGKFIPIAEETGLIVPIGEWVLRNACSQAVAWWSAGLRDFSVAVNISARQFSAGDLPAVVARALTASGLDPAYLELEVTESVAMHDVERIVATFEALKLLGVRISIDDFGTGYSSLSYLKRFPVDKLKIDQSFVRNMVGSVDDAEIVRVVIALAHVLELAVIAEGVETDEQRALLLTYGCEEIQGYLISPPQSAESLASWIPGVTFSVDRTARA